MKTKSIKIKLKEYFFLYPSAKLRVREIERTLKAPLPSVIRYCKELTEEDILTTHVIGNVTFYTASRSQTYLFEKKLFNLNQIHNSKLIEYLKIKLSNPVIILFGSYSKGEDREKSDIDLYIQSTTKVNVEKFEKFLQRNIQIFGFKSIKDLKNPHLANNIMNGITLNNYIEVF